jgi:hypothetical protein
MTPINLYVAQVDTTHVNVDKLPANLIAVMGYDTGTPDVLWIPPDWARFPGASHVNLDQSFALESFASGQSKGADIERGAGTVQTFIQAARRRMTLGLGSPLYISFDALNDALTQCVKAGITGVRTMVANYEWSETEARAYLDANAQAVLVQFANSGTNPRTVIPGTSLTMADVNCDLSVKRADWWPSPAIAGTAWTELGGG